MHTLYTQYCSHCLKKFCPSLEEIYNSKVHFFIPTLDEFHRPHFAFISMHTEVAYRLFEVDEERTIDINDYAEILHIEQSDWPSASRQAEIKHFYLPATSQPYAIPNAEQSRLAA